MLNWLKNLFKKREKLPKIELQDFLSEILVQVCNGIEDAQNRTNKVPIPEEEKKHFVARIVPSPINSSSIPSPRDNLYNVDLDIAIEIEKKSNSSNKFGITVSTANIDFIQANVNFEHKGSIDTKNSIIGKVRLTIPIIYPSVPNPHY